MGPPPGMPWEAGMGRGFPPGFREGFPGAIARQGSESPGDDDSEFGSSDDDRKRDRDSHRRRDRDRERTREHRERWAKTTTFISPAFHIVSVFFFTPDLQITNYRVKTKMIGVLATRNNLRVWNYIIGRQLKEKVLYMLRSETYNKSTYTRKK